MRAFILALFLFFLCGCEITIKRSPRSDAHDVSEPAFSPALFEAGARASACSCDPPCSSGYKCYSGECKPVAARARVASEV